MQLTSLGAQHQDHHHLGHLHCVDDLLHCAHQCNPSLHPGASDAHNEALALAHMTHGILRLGTRISIGCQRVEHIGTCLMHVEM